MKKRPSFYRIIFGFVFFPALTVLGQNTWNGAQRPRISVHSGGERQVAIIITENGYFPRRVTVFRGEKVRFFVTATQAGPHCFAMKGNSLFISAKKGHVNESEHIFEQSGEFEFSCPSFSYTGIVSVLNRSEDKARRPASTKLYDYWMPDEGPPL